MSERGVRAAYYYNADLRTFLSSDVFSALAPWKRHVREFKRMQHPKCLLIEESTYAGKIIVFGTFHMIPINA